MYADVSMNFSPHAVGKILVFERAHYHGYQRTPEWLKDADLLRGGHGGGFHMDSVVATYLSKLLSNVVPSFACLKTPYAVIKTGAATTWLKCVSLTSLFSS